jgi:hypothetical protein
MGLAARDGRGASAWERAMQATTNCAARAGERMRYFANDSARDMVAIDAPLTWRPRLAPGTIRKRAAVRRPA